MNISLYEESGQYCVASEDGSKVYQKIKTAIDRGETVSISFSQVTTTTSAYVRAAIGALYGAYSQETIDKYVSYTDLTPDEDHHLQRVIRESIQYYKDPKAYEEAIRRAEADL